MEAIEGIEGVRAIAWDFDGVLNVAGDAWRRVAEAELGLDPAALARAVFEAQPRALLTGAEDVLDRLQGWVDATGFEGDAEDILEILFEQDNDPDRDLLRLIAQLDRAGVAQVIATNTDARRARFLALDGGWAERVDAVFASGEMGAMKPDAGFFQQIEEAMGLAPHELLLIDDSERNTEAAEKRGWLAWHYRPGAAMALAQALMPLLLRGAEE
ncbi:MAG: HAD-IA family hydrolase [Rhodobacter sp.]|nr:HAD-IA family hydrolase [Paracoccaceae bacterium]MCC0076618.1 HAD-IA family hydrolase [Rhodobacter sp.]